MFIINGEAWNVRLVPPDHPMLLMPNGNWAVGVCDDQYKMILINNTLRGPYLKEVLGHEITHAAMRSYDIEMPYDEEEVIAIIVTNDGEIIIAITDVDQKQIR
jgi:hypothetical protein